MKTGATGLRRILNATRYSVKGLQTAWRHEAAFRQEVILLLIGAPLALWLGRSLVERILLIASLALVLIVELLNSAVEAVVDRIGPEHHELSGRAKDIGSAAVMVALLAAGACWLAVLASRLLGS